MSTLSQFIDFGLPTGIVTEHTVKNSIPDGWISLDNSQVTSTKTLNLPPQLNFSATNEFLISSLQNNVNGWPSTASTAAWHPIQAYVDYANDFALVVLTVLISSTYYVGILKYTLSTGTWTVGYCISGAISSICGSVYSKWIYITDAVITSGDNIRVLFNQALYGYQNHLLVWDAMSTATPAIGRTDVTWTGIIYSQPANGNIHSRFNSDGSKIISSSFGSSGATYILSICERDYNNHASVTVKYQYYITTSNSITTIDVLPSMVLATVDSPYQRVSSGFAYYSTNTMYAAACGHKTDRSGCEFIINTGMISFVSGVYTTYVNTDVIGLTSMSSATFINLSTGTIKGVDNISSATIKKSPVIYRWEKSTYTGANTTFTTVYHKGAYYNIMLDTIAIKLGTANIVVNNTATAIPGMTLSVGTLYSANVTDYNAIIKMPFQFNITPDQTPVIFLATTSTTTTKIAAVTSYEVSNKYYVPSNLNCIMKV